MTHGRRLASMFAVGIHSLLDFNLHIPANALLLTAVLGLTYVAVHLRHDRGRSVVTFRTRQLTLPHLLSLPLYPLAMLAVLALALPVAQSVAADRHARLASWAPGQPVLMATPLQLGHDDLRPLIIQLVQHPERAAQGSRQLVQTGTT